MDQVISDLSSTEDDSSGSDSFGLKTCESAPLDIRDVPGVSFIRDGKSDWTPVVPLSKRKREKWKEREKLLSLPHANTCSGSDSDLNLSYHCDAKYLVLDGTSGIQVGIGCGLLLLQKLAINAKVVQKNYKNTISISVFFLTFCACIC